MDVCCFPFASLLNGELTCKKQKTIDDLHSIQMILISAFAVFSSPSLRLPIGNELKKRKKTIKSCNLINLCLWFPSFGRSCDLPKNERSPPTERKRDFIEKRFRCSNDFLSFRFSPSMYKNLFQIPIIRPSIEFLSFLRDGSEKERMNWMKWLFFGCGEGYRE